MFSLKRGRAAAIATALLTLTLVPAAHAHQGNTGHKQTYSQPAASNAAATHDTQGWPATAPDRNSSNGG